MIDFGILDAHLGSEFGAGLLDGRQNLLGTPVIGEVGCQDDREKLPHHRLADFLKIGTQIRQRGTHRRDDTDPIGGNQIDEIAFGQGCLIFLRTI